MANIGSGVISKVRLAQQGSSPAAPVSTYWLLYVKSGGLYYKDSANNEYQVGKAADATSIQGKAVDPTAPTNGQVLIYSTGSGTYIPTTPNAGTVTSVAVTVPSDETVSGSPITGAGTLAISRNAQSGNKVLGSPADGSSGTPAFRALVAADIPTPTALDLRSAAFEYDDFLSGSATSGQVGKLGWTFANGAVTYQSPATPSGQGNPGLLRYDTNSTTATLCSLQASAGLAVLSPDLWDLTIILKTANAGADATMRFGLGSSPTSDPPFSGAFIEKLYADTTWFGVTRAGGTQTRTTSLGGYSFGVFQRFRIRQIDASTIGFTIDAGTEVTATANLPGNTHPLGVFFQILSDNGSTYSFDIDLVMFKVTGLAR